MLVMIWKHDAANPDLDTEVLQTANKLHVS